MSTHSIRKIAAVVALLIPLQGAGADASLASYLPSGPLAQFIVSDWDIRTISSSLNPRRTPQQAHFTDLGLSVSQATDERVVLEGPLDTFVIQVLRRGDANKDGIEDVVVCLSDSANGGTLAMSQAYVLQKYSQTTPLVALAYDIRDKRCPSR